MGDTKAVFTDEEEGKDSPDECEYEEDNEIELPGIFEETGGQEETGT